MRASSRTDVVAAAVRRLRLEVDRVTARVQQAGRRRRNAGRVFRPIFVAGAIGSGTSLLAASLGQRFSVAGVALESARDVVPSSCLWIDRVLSFDSIRAYEEKLSPQSDWSVAQAREDLLDLYRSRAAGDPGAVAFVDKGPKYGFPFPLAGRKPAQCLTSFALLISGQSSHAHVINSFFAVADIFLLKPTCSIVLPINIWPSSRGIK